MCVVVVCCCLLLLCVHVYDSVRVLGENMYTCASEAGHVYICMCISLYLYSDDVENSMNHYF